MAFSEEAKTASAPSSGEDTYAAITHLLPLPATTDPVTDPDKTDLAQSLGEEPTLSHSLAMADHDETGFAQREHDEETADLGWNKEKERISSPLVGGLDNEDLWLLTRRFNKQLYHVREIQNKPPGDLDLNISDDEEFSPDKLRATVERFYTTVVIGLLAVIKHVQRLRKWHEKQRTAMFCAAYFVAWVFDCIMPLVLILLVTLIVYPRSRGILFPPAPLALVSSKSGGIQKPKAGVLASHDSATGAAENHKGEAVEKEASNFFNGFTSVVVTSATGKHPQSDPGSSDKSGDDDTPDPTGFAVSAAQAQTVAAGGKPGSKHDKTKAPVENAVWNSMRPIMQGITDITDTWERFGNALSPTSPYPRYSARIRVAQLVAPLLIVSLFVTSYMFMKAVTFGVGFGFFGDPIISKGLHWLNNTFPHWQKLLEIRNTILKGVPTNAQLTLTLLRIGEANKAPLPPPPRASQPPPEKPVEITDAELRTTGAEPPLNATAEEIEAAIEHDPHTAHETNGADIDEAKPSKHGRKSSKVLGIIKGAVKGTVKSAIASDAARAKTGSTAAKNRLGVVPPANTNLATGPVDFQARFNGKKGRVYITTKSTIPAIGFSTDMTTETIGNAEREDIHPRFSIPIGDITELKKIGGYSWKTKIVVGWSLGREVNDSLEITDRQGNVWKLTALPLRDELFNRLISMGGQKWEAW
ncbi:hypothetical protein F5Y16DRAFT_390703 [Xylariaceae sp. FL0255]|nr:hypothetical protein F5Y16DRAFT_390703 [Xylariaceae sp. FL0255]